MRIPKRPEELSFTLPDHVGLEDAPVFHYGVPTPEEQAIYMVRFLKCADNVTLPDGIDPEKLTKEELSQLIGDADPDEEKVVLLYAQIFDEKIKRISNLTIGDALFAGRSTAAGALGAFQEQLRSIPGTWKLTVGKQIFARVLNPLSEEEEGNSSSPSSSAVTETTTADAPAAGVSTE